MGLLKRFLSLFKPSNSAQLPKMSAIPTASTDVTQWQMQLSEAIADGVLKLADVETMHVTKLELWKRPKSPFHEFLLAYISSPFHEDPICVLIDRTRTADKGTPSSSSQPKSMLTSIGDGVIYSTTSQSTPQDSLQIAASSSDSLNSRALDQFHRIAIPQGNSVDRHHCHLLKISHFHRGHQPNITDLISAAHTLSLSEEYYKLLKTQCYWFSGSLFIYLVGSVETPPDTSYRDRAEIDALTSGLLEEARSAGLREGRYRWITIFNSETVDVSALRLPVSQRLDRLRESLRKGEETRMSRLAQEIKDAQEAVKNAQEAVKAAESSSRMDRDARAKAESDARADREARARAESDAHADREARARAESDARADREAKARAESDVREAKARAESDAREAKARAESAARADRETKRMLQERIAELEAMVLRSAQPAP